MDNNNVKKQLPSLGWISFYVLLIVYTVVISGFVFTDHEKTLRNETEIGKTDKEWREEVRQVRKENLKYYEMTLNEIKELRKEIN